MSRRIAAAFFRCAEKNAKAMFRQQERHNPGVGGGYISILARGRLHEWIFDGDYDFRQRTAVRLAGTVIDNQLFCASVLSRSGAGQTQCFCWQRTFSRDARSLGIAVIFYANDIIYID